MQVYFEAGATVGFDPDMHRHRLSGINPSMGEARDDVEIIDPVSCF